MKTENNKKINNKKVTVHAFGTVHKPKITVHGHEQCQTRVKKKKNAENATQETQYPNATYILITYYFFYNFILLDSNYTRNIYN